MDCSGAIAGQLKGEEGKKMSGHLKSRKQSEMRQGKKKRECQSRRGQAESGKTDKAPEDPQPKSLMEFNSSRTQSQTIIPDLQVCISKQSDNSRAAMTLLKSGNSHF